MARRSFSSPYARIHKEKRAIVQMNSRLPMTASDDTASKAHWWLWEDGLGTFMAGGYVGQMIYVVPALDLILVRNGNTPVERRLHMVRLHRQIIDLFHSA